MPGIPKHTVDSFPQGQLGLNPPTHPAPPGGPTSVHLQTSTPNPQAQGISAASTAQGPVGTGDMAVVLAWVLGAVRDHTW